MFVSSSSCWHACLDVVRSVVMKFKTPYEQGKADCHYRRYNRERACWTQADKVEYDKGWEFSEKLDYYFDDGEVYDKDDF